MIVMVERVSHHRDDESLAAKARWFRTLSHAERFAMMCELATLAIKRNPAIAMTPRDASQLDYAHTPPERIRIVSQA